MRRKYAARAVVALTFGGESPSNRAIDLLTALRRLEKPQSWPKQGSCEAERKTPIKGQASDAATSAATRSFVVSERMPARWRA